MSKKVTALIGGLVASLALVVVATQGCGSSGGSGDYKALCMQGCDKVVSCTPDADATTVSQLRTACNANCNADTNCSNQSARVSAAKACLAMSDCAAFEACGATIPACQTTTGTGGSGTGAGGSGGSGTGGSGTGGSGTGTGGTSGGAWTCTDDGTSCTCNQAGGGTLTTCPTSYNCCVMYAAGGYNACSCTTLAAAQCTTIVTTLGGTKVSRCPQ